MLLATAPAPLTTADETTPSIDDLDRAIVNLAARLNAATHDFLVLVRRFDERAGWLAWGFESCADWLHWRCDLSLSAAREKVRVAHALKTLPAIAMSFASGELSYSKVRALTRVAGCENEDALLEFALRTTAARVEERCRELRCGTADSTDEAVRAHERRSLSLRRDPERGMVTITVELPMDTAELIDKALDRAVEATASSTPELAEESWAAQRADAFVAVATAYLGGAGEGETASGTSDHYQVVVHVDESALRGGAGRAGLPIESVRRIGCDASRVVLVEDEQGEPLSVGRKSRIVSQAIKRALWARDKGCRFPGCGRRRFVDAHHIRTGRRAARRVSPTWCCSARSTTRCCTRAASGSRRTIAIAGSSGAPTGARYRLAGIVPTTCATTISARATTTSRLALPRRDCAWPSPR